MNEPFHLPREHRDPITDELVRDVMVLTEEHQCWGHDCGGGLDNGQNMAHHLAARVSAQELHAHMTGSEVSGGHDLAIGKLSENNYAVMSQTHAAHHADFPGLFVSGKSKGGHDTSVGDLSTQSRTRDHLYAAHDLATGHLGDVSHEGLKAIHDKLGPHNANWQKGYDHGAKVLAAANKAADTRAVNNARRAGVTPSEIRHDLRGDK